MPPGDLPAPPAPPGPNPGAAAGVVHPGIFHWDLVHQRIEVSRAFEQVWSGAPGEFDGTYEAFWSRVHPEDRSGLETRLHRALEDRAPFGHEFRVVRPDGSLRRVSLCAELPGAASAPADRLWGTVHELVPPPVPQPEPLPTPDPEPAAPAPPKASVLPEILALLARSQRLEEAVPELLDTLRRDTGFAGARLRLPARGPGPDPGGAGEGFREWTAGAGEDAPFHEGNVATDESPGSPNPSGEPGTVVRYPIVGGPGTGGHLQVRDPRPGRMTPDLATMLEGVAGVLGLALRCENETRIALQTEARLRSEQALRDREAIFRTATEQAVDAIVVVDAGTGGFVEFNTAAHEGLGYTREEFARMGIPDIQADHSPETIRANFEHLLQQGSLSFESRHRHRDGTPRDVHVSIRRIDVQGRPHFIGVWIDITERKRAEHRARRDAEAAEFLLSLHQQALQWDDTQLREAVLGQALRLTDSRSGILLEPPASTDPAARARAHWFPDRHAAEDPTSDAALLGRLQAHCLEGRHPLLDNGAGATAGVVPRRVLGVPVVEQGRTTWVLAVADREADYDASEVAPLQLIAHEYHKIQARRAAQALLRRLSGAIEQSPVIVLITDTRGAIEYVNPMFTRITGYAPEEVLGRNPRILASGEVSAEVYHDLWSTLLAGRIWHGEFANRKKNGHRYWAAASISPIRDDTGKTTHYVGIQEDITRIKLLEAQVRQSQKLEAIGQLAGGVAHDFNNILAVLTMELEMLHLQADLPADVVGSVDEMQAAVQRATALTRQLLMFSRRSVLVARPLDLNDLVANLLRMLTRLIGENLDLTFKGRSGLPRVEADPSLLEQVLMNLVVNARDAMPEGGRIEIITGQAQVDPEAALGHPDRREGVFVVLSVADTGCGMDPATLKRIFEPFFTTKESGKGTGLGLATVHGIVAQHRGWVEVESRVGEGSRFHVYLPALDAAPRVAPEDAPSEALPRGTECLLLVEDETKVRRLTARLLTTLGYRVLEAPHGREALARFEQDPAAIDLLLTDMVMPEGTNGVELANRLRARRPGLKTILTSGYSAEIFKGGIPVRPDLAYLPKPFEARTLALLIRRLLDQRP